MLFSMQGKAPQGNGKMVHCGVLEFTAEEGKCYAPSWMMRQIGIDEGGLVEVANVTLPLGTYIKVQPHSSAFIDNISNHRAVLEYVLKNYAALTVGDNIVFNYNKRDYVLSVNEVKPDIASNNHAISVVETNIQIDFDPPKDTLSEKGKKGESKKGGSGGDVALSKTSSKNGFFEPGSLQSLMFYDPDVDGVGSSGLFGTKDDKSDDTRTDSEKRKPSLSSSSSAAATTTLSTSSSSSKHNGLSRSVGYRIDGKPVKKIKKKSTQSLVKKPSVDSDDDDDDTIMISNDNGGDDGDIEIVPFTGIGRSISGNVVGSGPVLTRSRNRGGGALNNTSSLSQSSGLSISSSYAGGVNSLSISTSDEPYTTTKRSTGHTLTE